MSPLTFASVINNSSRKKTNKARNLLTAKSLYFANEKQKCEIKRQNRKRFNIINSHKSWNNTANRWDFVSLSFLAFYGEKKTENQRRRKKSQFILAHLQFHDFMILWWQYFRIAMLFFLSCIIVFFRWLFPFSHLFVSFCLLSLTLAGTQFMI